MMMVIQTPLRISFMGGGTDIAEYYENNGGGAVISTTIDKYIYVIAKKRFGDKIRLGYSKTELVDSVDELEHELIREALKIVGIEKGIEIATIADIPSTGSGLGSSSAVTVGVLNALWRYVGEPLSLERLAQQACEIEIERCDKPIGKQDQYAAVYGGLNVIEFNADSTVTVKPIEINSMISEKLNANLLLFYTGISRKSEDILIEEKKAMPDKVKILGKMKRSVDNVVSSLKYGKLNDFGMLLDLGWQYKKKLASQITNSRIDKMYEEAIDAGAIGGKICGAGGGGFLLVYVPREKRSSVREALIDYRELPFRLHRY